MFGEVVTEHLTLRALSAADESVVGDWLQNDEHARRELGGAGFISGVAQDTADAAHVRGWVLSDDSGSPLAAVVVEYLSDRSAELFVIVAPDKRRHGHGRDVVRRVLAQGLGVPHVLADVHEENVASLRLLEACGFTIGLADATGFQTAVWSPEDTTPTHSGDSLLNSREGHQ
jgi:RimJ/RimL family protein N-acetyltransferase